MPSLSWPVGLGDLPEPAPAPYVPHLDAEDGGPVASARPELVGLVVAHPFAITGSGDVRTVVGPDAINAEIAQVLGMSAASGSTRGELEWDPARGALVNRIRHMPNNQATWALARTLVGQALENFVTSISVRNVTIEVEETTESGQSGQVMRITIVYEVKATGTQAVVEVQT